MALSKELPDGVGGVERRRRRREAQWEPTVPALVNLVAASGGPYLRAAFAAAGLDGIRPAQSVALVPLAAGGLHASDLAERLRVSRQAVAQAIPDWSDTATSLGFRIRLTREHESLS